MPHPASAAPQCKGHAYSSPTDQASCDAKCKDLDRARYEEKGTYISSGSFGTLDPSFDCCCPRKVIASQCQRPCLAGSICLENPLCTTDIPALIGKVLRGLFAIIGTIALIIFIYGGALWMTAFGEESKVKRGWDTMIWGAIGLVVIFGSYVAVDFILKAILGS